MTIMTDWGEEAIPPEGMAWSNPETHPRTAVLGHSPGHGPEPGTVINLSCDTEGEVHIMASAGLDLDQLRRYCDCFSSWLNRQNA